MSIIFMLKILLLIINLLLDSLWVTLDKTEYLKCNWNYYLLLRNIFIMSPQAFLSSSISLLSSLIRNAVLR